MSESGTSVPRLTSDAKSDARTNRANVDDTDVDALFADGPMPPLIDMRRASLSDPTLSFRARGLLAFLCELSDEDFPVTIELLVDLGTEGRDAIRTTVAELLDAGILERRQNHERGRFARSGLYLAGRWAK